MDAFATLGIVPLETWLPSDSFLLEEALESRGSAADEATCSAIDAALGRVWDACAASAPKGLGLALSLLTTTTSAASKFFALSVFEKAISGWKAINSEQRRALLRRLDEVDSTIPQMAMADQGRWTERMTIIRRLLKKVTQENQISLSSSSSVSSFRPAMATGTGHVVRPAMRKSNSLTDGFFHAELQKPKKRPEDVFERDTVGNAQIRGPTSRSGKPISATAWNSKTTLPYLTGQTVFKGSQFKIPTLVDRSVGRAHFQEAHRCTVSTF